MIQGERIAILGASRGLGHAFAKELDLQSQNCEILLSSRRIVPGILCKNREKILVADFVNEQEKVIAELLDFQPQRILYFAAGGPYGYFSSKEWKDHQWALEVTFLFPARLLHVLLQNKVQVQMVFIGSAIAEENKDPFAASYAASKHALKGLISSVQEELLQTKVKSFDLRLFSPGYMDTDMLPPQAWPRHQPGVQISNVKGVVDKLLSWMQNDDAYCSAYRLSPFER